MGRIRKDGGRDRRFKENKNSFEPGISKGKKVKKGGCLKKLGCLGLLLLPLAIFGLKK